MPTCKDCIHYEPCKDSYYNAEQLSRFPLDFLEKENAEKNCAFFKDRSKFIELRHGFWKKKFIKLQPEFKGGFVFEPKQEIAQCSICCRKIAVGNDSVMFPFCPCCGGKMDEYEQALKEQKDD